MMNEKEKIKTTTKKVLWVLITCAVIWITWSYILATISLIVFGETDALSDLSQQVCITIVGSTIGYFVKSYLENKSKANTEFEYYKLNNGHADEESDENDEMSDFTFEDIGG